MRGAWLGPVVLVVFPALASPAAGGTAQGELTGGAPDTVHTAVGVVTFDGLWFCGATLVGPRLVLTAAHCVAGPQVPNFFLLGNDYSTPDQVLAIDSFVVDPLYDAQTLEHDFAVIQLVSSVGSIAPMALLPPDLDDLAIDTVLVLVGFGATEAGSNTVRRQGSAMVSSLDVVRLATDGPSQMCDGDSGGPALYEVGGIERIAGVASFTDGACPATTTSYHARVSAAYESFLAPLILPVFADGFESGDTLAWTFTVP